MSRVRGAGAWRVPLGGLAATLIGNGIGRFAYTPLIPALIAAGWFSPAEAVYLAAANLAGYLAGALGAAPLGRRLGSIPAMRLAAIATVLSLVACAWPFSFAWYVGWRFLAGATGGVLMVLAVPAVLAVTAAERRGRAAGIVITGVGLGIAAAGTVVPALAGAGPRAIWLGLAAIAALLAAYAWIAIPDDGIDRTSARQRAEPLGAPILLLIAAYASDALGFIPHTVFWVDYIARGLGLGLDVGGAYWALFGLGATLGPFLSGMAADRFGPGRAFVGAMAIKAAGVAVPLAGTGHAGLLVSSLVVGSLISGTTTLCSAWVADQAGLAHHRRIWGWATSAFAVAQAGGAWVMSHLFAVTQSYSLLFAIGTAALAAGAGLALGSLHLAKGRLPAAD